MIKLQKLTSFVKINVTQHLLYHASEGIRIKPFFLPVRSKGYSNQIECWILPLAIPMIVFYIVRGILLSIWYDLVSIVNLLEEWNKETPEEFL